MLLLSFCSSHTERLLGGGGPSSSYVTACPLFCHSLLMVHVKNCEERAFSLFLLWDIQSISLPFSLSLLSVFGCFL